MKEQTVNIDISQIERLYFDKVLEIKCPKCGKILKRDFNEDYLSFMEVSKKMSKDDYVTFYCQNCGMDGYTDQYKIPFRLKAAKIIVEYDLENIKPE